MLDPTRPLNNSDDREVNNWAKLEGKSDSMTEDLAQRIELASKPSQVGVWLRTFFAWVIVLSMVLALVALVFYVELRVRGSDPFEVQNPGLERAIP